MSDDAGWDVEVKPYLTPRFAYGAAVLIVAAHVTVGALLKVGTKITVRLPARRLHHGRGDADADLAPSLAPDAA